MKKYYVYIIRCCDKSYYTGVSNDVYRRFLEHESGTNKTCYTYSRRPLEFVYYAEFMDVNIAIDFEKKIKKWSRVKKEALINSSYSELPNLSKKKFD